MLVGVNPEVGEALVKEKGWGGATMDPDTAAKLQRVPMEIVIVVAGQLMATAVVFSHIKREWRGNRRADELAKSRSRVDAPTEEAIQFRDDTLMEAASIARWLSKANLLSRGLDTTPVPQDRPEPEQQKRTTPGDSGSEGPSYRRAAEPGPRRG